MIDSLGRLFRFLASLKVAIPLLVLTIAVTGVATLFPDREIYRSWWYLSLLGLNGVSLLFITILHVPMILQRRGRNALIGVVVTHLGILLLIVGIIWGGVSGFRHNVRAIENEMTVVPGLPFVIHLDRLVVEEFPPDQVAHIASELVPKKVQDSHISLFRQGRLWRRVTISPGNPAQIDGITILPSIRDIGWYFELAVTAPDGRVRVVPVKPWAPPLIEAGEQQIMAHALMDTGELHAQVFTVRDGGMSVVGTIGDDKSLELNGYQVSLSGYKRYTGLTIYGRPHAPILVLGCVSMMLGLLWHFYFRHRDSKEG
jgi:hypothetical protein